MLSQTTTMKKSWLLFFLFPLQILTAQSYEEESLLFSRNSISGTARTIGSGGAYGSVGADLGSLAINPAGIGLYRSTDISITPGLSVVNNDAQFNGSATNTSTPKIYINQAGIVFTKIFKDAEKQNDFTFTPHRLKTFSFAINYQRQNMLGSTQNFAGFNNTNSGISAYTDYLNATRLPFNTDNYPVEMLLASDEGLIGYDSISDTYYSNVNAPINQSGTITNKGGVDQIDLTFGGNVSDKFYFGAGMGFSILSFQKYKRK